MHVPDHSLILRDALRVVLLRDLRALDSQIAAYPDDESIWKTAPGISNSGGTLVLHLAGNLRHFFGTVLGGSAYARNREAEFSMRGLSRAELQQEVQATLVEIEAALERIEDAQLAAAYPLPIGDRRVRTAEFLVHLAVHLAYHLGQLDYHRRILTPHAGVVDTMSIRELPAHKDP
ncbi:MAG: DUF1572 family protein [Gemmatimonadaceae bacterium]|nr:DUF1572 family protein [Gemmatimonadaceae bacterium]